MSLKHVVENAIRRVQAESRSVRQSITYTVKGDGYYDPISGGTITTDSDYQVSVLANHYRQEEIDGKVVQPYDKKAILFREEIEFTPKVSDKVTMPDGGVWDVLQVRSDTSQKFYSLQLRAM